jgi:hypothetical protein
MTHFFVLCVMLFCSVTCSNISHTCYVGGNNYIISKKEEGKNKLVFENFLCGIGGYSMISFVNPETQKEDYSFILWDSNKVLIKNNENFTVVSNKSSFSVNNLWMQRNVRIEVSSEYFKNNSIISVNCNTFSSPWLNESSKEWVIPHPTESVKISKSSICTFYWCETTIAYKKIYIHMADNVLMFMLMFLTLIGMNWQPMKSRGLTSFLALSFIFLDVNSIFISFLGLYSFEFAYKHEHFMNLLIFFPIFYNSRILMLIV